MSTRVQTFIADFNGRLDRQLRERLPATHSLVCKMVRSGKVTVNNQRSKDIAQKVTIGSKISISEEFELQSIEIKTKHIIVPRNVVIVIKSCIVFENEDLCVVNKPYGLATQSGGSLKFSLDDVMRKIYGEGSAKIVHRLDRETSGLIVFAKNKSAASFLCEAFSSREIEKRYIAVVSGMPKVANGVINAPISREFSLYGGKMKCFAASGNSDEARSAITKYKTIRIDKKQNISLVEFIPITGRTHQIRIHAAKMGFPILGDYRYNGNTEITRKLNLCAYSITLPPEILNHKIELKNLPDHFVLDF